MKNTKIEDEQKNNEKIREKNWSNLSTIEDKRLQETHVSHKRT